jgi:hypothetical protein
MTDDQVAGMCIALLLAGQHTSSTTGAWLGFYMCDNPKIQYVPTAIQFVCCFETCLFLTALLFVTTLKLLSHQCHRLPQERFAVSRFVCGCHACRVKP